MGVGKPPSPRMFFSDSIWDENRILIYGGILTEGSTVLSELIQLDLDDYHWSLPFCAGINPNKRYNCSSVFFHN